MSIPVEENAIYIPQVFFNELNEEYQDEIETYRRHLECGALESFDNFLQYLLVNIYCSQTEGTVKTLFKKIAEANPEFVQHLMALRDNDFIKINLRSQKDKLYLVLPVSLLGNIRNMLKTFILEYSVNKYGADKINSLQISDYYKLINKEFLKNFNVWLNPQHKLRKKKMPMLLMNKPNELRVIQEKTAPIKKEVTIVDDTSSKEKLEQRMKEDEDENFFESQVKTPVPEQKTDLKKVTMENSPQPADTTKIPTFPEYINTNSSSDLKSIVISRKNTKGQESTRVHPAACAKGASCSVEKVLEERKNNLLKIRQERRNNLFMNKRLHPEIFGTLGNIKESLKEQNKEDLKKVESEKK